MTDISKAGTYKLGDRTVKRLGYGAMQLAGPGVFGPPKDRDAARKWYQQAKEAGDQSAKEDLARMDAEDNRATSQQQRRRR